MANSPKPDDAIEVDVRVRSAGSSRPRRTCVSRATTVVPVMEERLVVFRQPVPVEEVRIPAASSNREPVPMRRQRVVIERFDAEGHPIDGDRP